MNNLNQNQNPFADIMTQMNNAKLVYDNTMSSLQQQLHAARQQAANLYNPYQQQQMPPINQVIQPVSEAPQPETVPVNVQHLTALGEIRVAIDKTNELLDKFINGVPVAKDEKKDKPVNNPTAK